MKQIHLLLLSLLFTIGCKHQNDLPSLRNSLPKDHYYPAEIFNGDNAKIYGKWKFLYKQGGFGGWFLDPTFDFLEIVPFGIYGIIDNDAIQLTGKIQIDQQNQNGTLIELIPDNSHNANPDYLFMPKSVWLWGPDTLILFDLCADCYADVFKRI